MRRQRSRFSHRHLLALGTFLVPLAFLAGLGWMELQRSFASAQAALEREAQGFLKSARQAIEQQLELQLAPALASSARLLAEHGPVRTTLHLRHQEGFAALGDIVLLDEQAALVWPALPPYALGLPLVRDAQRGAENTVRTSLEAAELLIVHGRTADAIRTLQQLIATLEEANPPGRNRRVDLEEAEVQARLRLAAAHKKARDFAAAREQFGAVQRLAGNFPRSYRYESDMPAYALTASAALAELGSPDDRVAMLRRIAENDFDSVADGLSTAIAHRLAGAFALDDERRPEVDALLGEELQRAATRSFAASYEVLLKYGLRMRLMRQLGSDDGHSGEERLVATLGDRTSLLAVRPATIEEQQRWSCAHVALNLDLLQMLAPALAAFVATDGNFVLALRDPDDVQLVPPPRAVPDDFTPPSTETNGLTLHAYPADPGRLAAEARAAADKRLMLLVALFVTALGGALWSWRSVSRETELAAMKIDLVSRVSHELKTPLALIRMYGETLGMGRARDSDQAAEFGSIIARESERLTTLIQRILDFSRQQAGTLQYSAQPLDLGELLRTVVDAYAPHLEAMGAVVVDDLPPGITVHCDVNAAESAIVNLLENAAKYGPDGGSEHEIEVVLSRAAGDAIVEVRDRGRGIPAGERRRVFEGFYRASNAGEVRGAGLGLGIVMHFARAHGGDVEALGRDGGGTVVRLTLPLAGADRDGRANRETT